MATGGIYFSTSTGFVVRWDAQGRFDIVANTGLQLTDIAFSPDGHLYGITFDSFTKLIWQLVKQTVWDVSPARFNLTPTV